VRVLFWLCLALIAYAYFGYAVWLWLCARVRSLPIRKSSSFNASVSIIIAARNEEANLPTKLENLRQLKYPAQLLEVVVASDGSTDGTARILSEQASNVVAVILEESKGKACALNEAVRHATGEFLVFMDARQYVELDAVSELVSCFADPCVGAVTGELLLDSSGAGAEEGLGIYWKIEKIIRKLESASGSVVGVTGAIYAIRRELYTEIPSGTILDDVFVPMNVARKGKRVVFESSAIARDRLFAEKGKEFSRKVRTLTGNYQLLRLSPWLLSPANPLFFRFLSHKLMRLVVPMLLVLMLLASGVAGGPVYRTIFCLQVLFYVLAVFGTLVPSVKQFKPVGVASTFVMLNAAAALAFYNFAAGRKKVWL
jgi:biofilm PGA synthesis N-glycosyltransferase PgaC